jgi:nicotinic acid mononucleotide adenylyltransferase
MISYRVESDDFVLIYGKDALEEMLDFISTLDNSIKLTLSIYNRNDLKFHEFNLSRIMVYVKISRFNFKNSTLR